MKTLNSELNFLLPIKVKKLIRLGRNFDGGYLVCARVLKKCNNLITLGVGDDTSFERDFYNLSKMNKIFMYDYSVNYFLFIKIILKYVRRFLTFRGSLFSVSYSIKNFFYFIKLTSSKNVKFFKEKIVLKPKKKNHTTLKKIFLRTKSEKKNLLKIDIEGGEYQIIDEILINHKDIEMLVIEFHWINRNKKQFINSVKKLKKKFSIIHIHANNYNPVNNKDYFYDVVELSFVNKRNTKYSKYNKQAFRYKFPIPNIDFECFSDRSSINFRFNKN
jgi:hypothetical protein